MGIVTIILLGVLVLVVVWAVMIHNNLVKVKHNVSCPTSSAPATAGGAGCT